MCVRLFGLMTSEFPEVDEIYEAAMQLSETDRSELLRLLRLYDAVPEPAAMDADSDASSLEED